jgi:uncharacterized protein with von Willebrand factor type A (vWA) domain
LQALRRKPCSEFDDGLVDLLRDAARMQMGQGLDYDSKMMERVRERSERRFGEAQRREKEVEEKLERLRAELMGRTVERLLGSESIGGASNEDGFRSEIEELENEAEELGRESRTVTREDFDEALGDLEKRGLLDNADHKVKLTSKGAQLLGRGFLTRILMNLARRGVGAHRAEDIGHGPWSSASHRPYEPGDPYDKINIEQSLLAVLERTGDLGSLGLGDFRIHESRHAAEVQFGVIVDQSASMRKKGKIEAAVETALALSELMRTEFPEDRLRVYAFSEEFRLVEPWQLPGVAVPMRYTDIRAPLRAFRLAVAQEPGNKQVHLITDSAPNFLDGEFVGFKAALGAVLDEARLYRMTEMVLNVVMLDDDPELREMAKRVAQENMGRVFFADPRNLGEAIVEDYLWSKRELLSL